MRWLERLRERWGGQLRPSVRCYTEAELIERWDGRGSGQGAALCFEGFGLSFMLFVGPTPDVEHR